MARDIHCRPIVFEALFVHALGDSLREDLVRVGFDSRNPESTYPLRVLDRSLAIAASSLRFAHLSYDEAYLRLGEAFIEGILQTTLGQVVGVAILLSGPARTARRLPSLIRSDYGVETRFEPLGSRRAQLVSEPGLPPWMRSFFAGIVRGSLARTRDCAPVVFGRAGSEPGSFLVEFSW